MRSAIVVAMLWVSACASERLALAPPPGVDFSGRWQLNVADSDDPQHLIQVANAPTTTAGSPDPGGRGGRGGGGRARAPGGGAFTPMTPSLGSLGEGLGWPGNILEVKQVGGVVAFSSNGRNRVCQPADGKKPPRRHHSSPGRDDDAPAGRDAPPPLCGWSDKTLIVQGGDPDEDRPPYEEHYGLSDDGQRLVEVVSFRGGRSNGFTMSRVWDRLPK